uniref:Exonuclease domain-containing protein n=1 Tax=Parascaris univalens TaxID=6257 RepID=A0A914ZRG5_PARUN
MCEFFGDRCFARMQKEVANSNEFWNALLNVPISRVEQIREIVAEGFDPLTSFISKNLKGDLLMSVEQMANFAYPFPGDAQLEANGVLSQYRIQPTMRKYCAITADSPLFAIDCEMCVTKTGSRELTRITLVDEKCNVVIDTLVKPYDEIVDYVTKFSGITKQMLDPIDVRLEHVQIALSRLLPKDAILVGHSLEYDLRALQLSHPYCIDIASIFNLSGSEKQRSSLKTLASVFLGETIQDKRGHCSVEDAVATMQLLKLKLERGFQFGNVSLGWSYDAWARMNGLTNTGARIDMKRPHPVVANETDLLQPPAKKKRQEKDRRSCRECGRIMNVECSVEDCKCRSNKASVCVVCCVPLSAKPTEELREQLDWGAAIGMSSCPSTRPLIDEVVKSKNKSMLCCANGEICSFESSSRAKFYDTRSFQSADELLRIVGGEILEHNLVVIGIDTRLLSSGQDRPAYVRMDNIIESIVSSASPKSLIVLILSSPQESTCRISVKP